MSVKSLCRAAVETYVFKGIKKGEIVPYALKWVKELSEIKPYETEDTIQARAVLLNDKKTMNCLIKLGFLFNESHLECALTKNKNESALILIKLNLVPPVQSPFLLLENQALYSSNAEGVKLLLMHDQPTVERTIASGCLNILKHCSNDEIWDDLFRYIRDNISFDYQLLFANCILCKNIRVLKIFDNPAVEYPNPEHINASPNIEFYEYFISRGLVASTRLFVLTGCCHLVKHLLDIGMRPTELDVKQTRSDRKLNLYRRYGNIEKIRFWISDDEASDEEDSSHVYSDYYDSDVSDDFDIDKTESVRYYTRDHGPPIEDSPLTRSIALYADL